jgi:3-methylcrotonyl-CoA carboxylase beta subunit
VVIANDNTVASGSWWPLTPEKIERAQEMALPAAAAGRVPRRLLGPVPAGAEPVVPGAHRRRAHLQEERAARRRRRAADRGVFGDCIAGGGYMPIISDRVVMTEQAYMVIAGAALIKGAKSAEAVEPRHRRARGARPPVGLRRRARARRRHRDRVIRREIGELASSGRRLLPARRGPAPPAFDAAELGALFPADHREAYDVEQVLARLVDDSPVPRGAAARGREMIVGVGRVGGLWWASSPTAKA